MGNMTVNYRTITNQSPCAKDCQKRSASCHCTCTDYKQWREALDAQKASIRKKKDIDALYCTHREDVFYKIAKRNKKY